MDGWHDPKAVSRTLMDDSSSNITFKDESFFQNYFVGTSAKESEYECDPFSYMPDVHSSNLCLESFTDEIHGFEFLCKDERRFPLSCDNISDTRLDSTNVENQWCYSLGTWSHQIIMEITDKEKNPPNLLDGITNNELKVASHNKEPSNSTSGLIAKKLNKQSNQEKVISLEVVRQHFNVSLKEAAKMMGVCPTTLKRICRHHGITRWPSRKIKKVNQSLKKLQLVVDSVEGVGGGIKLGYPTISELIYQDPKKINQENVQVQDLNNCVPSSSDCSSSTHNSSYNDTSNSRFGLPCMENEYIDQLKGNIKVKATMGDLHIRFTLLTIWNFRNLKEEIMKKFAIDMLANISFQYLDCENEFVLLNCDEDLKECREMLTSNNIYMLKVFVFL